MFDNSYDLVFKEKFGSSDRERLYHNQQGQNDVGFVEESRKSNVISTIARVFLPQGYPESVSADYLEYQKWDTLQAFCSTIMGTLATKQVLQGVGVGDDSATPLAATTVWVFKEACGHLGRIVFAFARGTHLDAYSKKWRLHADVLNDMAFCIEMALPLYPNYTTLCLCSSTVMKAVVGVAGGATRAALTQHHAVRGNMADVAAKDSSQETAVNLIASVTGLFIMHVFPDAITLFFVLMFLHIIFNYLAVCGVCLKTLNEPRYMLTIVHYFVRNQMPTPQEINLAEPFMFNQMGSWTDKSVSGFTIKVGCSMKRLVQMHVKTDYLRNVKQIYTKRMFIMLPNIHTRKIYVILKEDATATDILQAYFHATLLAISICAINDHDLAILSRNHETLVLWNMCDKLKSAEWSRAFINSKTISSPNEFLHQPSYQMMKFMDETAENMWLQFSKKLRTTGWDVSKQLLLVDEWRVLNYIYDVENEPTSLTQGKSDILTSKTDISEVETFKLIEPGRNVMRGYVNKLLRKHYISNVLSSGSMNPWIRSQI